MSSNLKRLTLPETYEEVMRELGGVDNINARLAEFVTPVQSAERAIAVVAAQVGGTGRVVFILGDPGTGKSTFIHSLAWRPSTSVRSMHSIDCANSHSADILGDILARLRTLVPEAIRLRDAGVTAVTLDYLESLDEQDDTAVKAFFRSLNGILRSAPLLILWPVVSVNDVNHMLEMAAAVSGTIFVRGSEVVKFEGPPTDRYSSIAKNTIAVLNDGIAYSDFNLTDDDLEDATASLMASGKANITIRNYILAVRDKWAATNNYLTDIQARVPKHTEIWFVVAYPGAEETVSGFARKSRDLSDAWRASRDKLSEYLHENQRSASWNSKRLQYALTGAFDTRIMFIPTNALVACAAAYSSAAHAFPPQGLTMPATWGRKAVARRFLANSPLGRHLAGLPPKMGKRRGGTAAGALDAAEPGYALLAERAAGKGEHSDEPINHALAAAIRDVCGNKVNRVVAERSHAWLSRMVPDITVETADGRLICIEMHYTSRNDDYVLAGYVLDKLDKYMIQLQAYLERRA